MTYLEALKKRSAWWDPFMWGQGQTEKEAPRLPSLPSVPSAPVGQYQARTDGLARAQAMAQADRQAQEELSRTRRQNLDRQLLMRRLDYETNLMGQGMEEQAASGYGKLMAGRLRPQLEKRMLDKSIGIPTVPVQPIQPSSPQSFASSRVLNYTPGIQAGQNGNSQEYAAAAQRMDRRAREAMDRQLQTQAAMLPPPEEPQPKPSKGKGGRVGGLSQAQWNRQYAARNNPAKPYGKTTVLQETPETRAAWRSVQDRIARKQQQAVQTASSRLGRASSGALYGARRLG